MICNWTYYVKSEVRRSSDSFTGDDDNVIHYSFSMFRIIDGHYMVQMNVRQDDSKHQHVVVPKEIVPVILQQHNKMGIMGVIVQQLSLLTGSIGQE